MDILDNDNFDLLLKASAVTLPTKIYKTLRMVEDGQLTKDAATQVFARLASERYPGDRLAVSKFLSDGDGSRLMNAMVASERVAKMTGSNDMQSNPANRQRPQPEPDVEHPSEDVTFNTDGAPNKFAAAAREMAVGHAKLLGLSLQDAMTDLIENSQYYRLLLRAAGESFDKDARSAEISSAAPKSAKPHREDTGVKGAGARKPKHRQSVDPNDQDNSEDTTKSYASAACDYAHSLALEHAARHSCSLDKSYSDLLASDRFFQNIWKLGTVRSA